MNFFRAKQALLKIQLMSNYSWSKLNFQQLNYDVQINYLIIISMSLSLSRFLDVWNLSFILKFQSFSSVLAKFKRDNSDKRVGCLKIGYLKIYICTSLIFLRLLIQMLRKGYLNFQNFLVWFYPTFQDCFGLVRLRQTLTF